MSHLFSPYKIRDVEIQNRVWMSPMCQYSSEDGIPNNWHMVHLGSRAVGGAGLVMVGASGVTPEGRISYGDNGIWSDAQVEAFKPITRFIRAQGAVTAIQLAHAGRKGSTELPWLDSGHLPLTGVHAWQTLAPSAIPFNAKGNVPKAMTREDIESVVHAFERAAQHSLTAGFQIVEIHAAHGYLLHEFLSPLSNKRTDAYGGSLENRMRLVLEVAKAVRQTWPQNLPVFVRISATDWVEGGWDIEQSITLAGKLKEIGIDLIDCSSGGLVPDAKITVGPSYQVPFAEMIRARAGIATAAVGMITEAKQADDIITQGKADAVFLARALLREPYWPLQAARELKADITWPNQYGRARP